MGEIVKKWIVEYAFYDGDERFVNTAIHKGKDIVFDTEQEAQDYINKEISGFAIGYASETYIHERSCVNYKEIDSNSISRSTGIF